RIVAAAHVDAHLLRGVAQHRRHLRGARGLVVDRPPLCHLAGFAAGTSVARVASGNVESGETAAARAVEAPLDALEYYARDSRDPRDGCCDSLVPRQRLVDDDTWDRAVDVRHDAGAEPEVFALEVPSAEVDDDVGLVALPEVCLDGVQAEEVLVVDRVVPVDLIDGGAFLFCGVCGASWGRMVREIQIS
ncbi:hypothetical protein THAOC_12050, partial [Thalassiosira oceanica]